MTTFDDLDRRLTALENLVEHGPASWLRGAAWVTDVTSKLTAIHAVQSVHTDRLNAIDGRLDDMNGRLDRIEQILRRIAGEQ